jgi:hypothetical protein
MTPYHRQARGAPGRGRRHLVMVGNLGSGPAPPRPRGRRRLDLCLTVDGPAAVLPYLPVARLALRRLVTT